MSVEDRLLVLAAEELDQVMDDESEVKAIVRWMQEKLDLGHAVTMIRGHDEDYCEILAGSEVRLIDSVVADKVAAEWNRPGRKVKQKGV